MEIPLTAENGDNGTMPRDSNLLPFYTRRIGSTTDHSPHIIVFKTGVLRRLLVLSVFILVCQIVQLICQVCLIMQSKRLSVSTVSAVLVIWTVLSLTLTAQWVLLLGSNRIGMYINAFLKHFMRFKTLKLRLVTYIELKREKCSYADA